MTVTEIVIFPYFQYLSFTFNLISSHKECKEEVAIADEDNDSHLLPLAAATFIIQMAISKRRREVE